MNIDLFINSYLTSIRQRYAIQSDDLAFEILSISAFLGISFDEVISEISTLTKGADGNWSGTYDGGFDGIYIDEESDSIIIFQTKNTGGLKETELSRFLADYDHIFCKGNKNQITLNNIVKAKLQNFEQLTISGRVFNPKLMFIFNGEKTQQNLDLVEKFQNANPYLEILDKKDLLNQISSLRQAQKKRKDVEFVFMPKKSNIASSAHPQTVISFAIGSMTALSFRLSALDLCKLMTEEAEINGHYDHLFGGNIRGFLGNRGANVKIRETIESDFPEIFPFINNGLTIISEKVKFPTAPQAGEYPITTENPVIVNGLQTTRVIFDVFQKCPDKLLEVDIMVRLYEADDKDIVRKITAGTNTQSQININDKISNEDFNSHAKTIFENYGIGYLNKRGDSFENRNSNSLTDSISSEVLLKYWWATYMERPELAKSSKNRVLQLISDATTDTRNPLNHYFNGNVNSELYGQLLNVYDIHKFVIEKRLNDSENSPDIILHIDEIMAYSIHRLLPTGYNLRKINTPLLPNYEKAFAAILVISQEEQLELRKNNLSYAHNNYFKNSKSRYDLNKKMGWVEKSVVEEW